MLRQRPFLVEILTAAGLIAAPFVLPHLGFTPTTINRILVWGLFGIGFDILFGFTGLLSFGQSAFFGTGGMVAAYLLTVVNFPYVMPSLFIGTIVAAVVGYLVGLIALRRTGIYFAMITVAIAEVFYLRRVQSAVGLYRRRERAARRADAERSISASRRSASTPTGRSMRFSRSGISSASCIALRIVRSPVGAVLRAIRDNPLRAAAVGHNIHGYKLTAFVIAAAYAGFAGGLLGVMQGFMPPDAFMFDTSGQLVMQTAIGGAGTLFGPLVGATVWLYLQRLPADHAASRRDLEAGARRRVRAAGLLPAPRPDRRHRGSLSRCATGPGKGRAVDEAPVAGITAEDEQQAAAAGRARAGGRRHAGAPSRNRPQVRRRSCRPTGLTKHYGGLVANSDIDFTVNHGELRGIIGPNGAGKTTFFKMLTCEVPPTSGQIVFEGRDITGMTVTDVCQLGLTKSYQVNQLFNRLTVRENLTIAALAELRGKFRLDLFRIARAAFPASTSRSSTRSNWSIWPGAPTRRFRSSPMARSAGSRSGWRSRPRQACLLLDEPLAGMSPRERVETVRLLKSISPRPHHDHHRSRHGFAVRTGRARHRSAGRPGAGRRHAGRNQGQRKVQEAYLGGVHGVLAANEPARGQRSQQLLRGQPHPLRRRAARRAERGGGAARPQRRRQEHDA